MPAENEERRLWLTPEAVLDIIDRQVQTDEDGEPTGEPDRVHTFVQPGAGMFLGADWDVPQLEELLSGGATAEVGGEHCRRSKHGVCVWRDGKSPLFVATRGDVDWQAVEAAAATESPVAVTA